MIYWAGERKVDVDIGIIDHGFIPKDSAKVIKVNVDRYGVDYAVPPLTIKKMPISTVSSSYYSSLLTYFILMICFVFVFFFCLKYTLSGKLGIFGYFGIGYCLYFGITTFQEIKRKLKNRNISSVFDFGDTY